MGSDGTAFKRGEMKITDLGELKGEVVLFGGPYSNAHATSALLAGLDGRAAICTGDIVAYCGEAMRTVRMIRDAKIPVVAGNCEVQLGAGADSCGCGFEENTTCDLLSAGWYGVASAAVDAETRSWMQGLPDVIRFRHAGLSYGVIHGGVSDIARFLWPSTKDEAFREEIALLEDHIGRVDAVISGHSGIPFQRAIQDRLWINAGVIGMPPHDGRPETRYGVLRDDGVRFHRLSYDHHGARARMEEVGLTQGYHSSLVSGIWPSEDVLPPEMRGT